MSMTPEKLDRYLYLDCYLLACALNELTGWPRVQQVSGGRASHALVQMPDGRLLDAAGPHDPGEFPGFEPFHDDQWFPLHVPDDEQHWPDEQVRADARELLATVGV